MKKYFAAFLFVVAMPIYAEDLVEPLWLAEVALGYTNKTGNTDSSEINFDGDLTRAYGDWKHEATLEYDYESNDEQTTDDDLYTTWQSNYYLDKANYAYGFGSFKDDRYSGIDEEFVLSAGYGRILLNDDIYYLEVEGGPGVRFTNPTDGDEETALIARLGEKFTWVLTEHSRFKQDFSVDTGGGNTSTRFSAAVETDINSSLALRLSYEVDYVYNVPAGKDKTDTKTIIAIVYKLH
ncbi:MAG TPA: DUF481 domain-containing protein [Pseudomonadales bacterium]|jgi:putative salt-induced outer membrane protein